MASLALAIAASCFFFVFPAAIQAQTTDNIHYPETTIDSRMRSQATVDPVSHALQLQIPLGSIPGRGGASIPVNLHYSSKLWVIKWVETDTSPGPSYSTIYGTDYAHTSNAGWNSSLDWFNYPVLSGSPCHFYDGSGNEVGCGQKTTTLTQVARMFVRLPDGSTHELRRDTGTYATATFGTGQLPGIYYAVDGSHLKYDASSVQVQTLYMPDGSRYKYNNDSNGNPLSINYIDRNGNTLTYSYSTGQWTDTLNRTINRPVSGANQLPGFNNNSITYTLRYQNLGDSGVLNQTNTGGPNNSTALLSIGDRVSTSNCSTVPSLFTSPGGMCGGDDDHALTETTPFNPTVLYQIVLADGSTYTFNYDVYGEINRVTYPTGGYQEFTYGAAPNLGNDYIAGSMAAFYAQANRGVTSSWTSVKGDGLDIGGTTWQYGMTTVGTYPNQQFATTTTAPDGTETQYWMYRDLGVYVPTGGGFAPIAFGFSNPLSGRVYDQRVLNSSGQILRRTLTQWTVDGSIAEAGNSGTEYLQSNPRPTEEVNILLDTGGNALAATTTMAYDSYQNVTSTSHYDYASVAASTAQTGGLTLSSSGIYTISSIPQGTLLRTEQTDYLTTQSYINRNLVSLPVATRIEDSNGNIIAQSKMSYDETALTDTLNRLTSVSRPDGGSTTYSYSDTSGSFNICSSTVQNSTQSNQSCQYFDGLGRENRAFQTINNSPLNYNTVDTVYDALGRVSQVSNPYFSTGAGSAVNPSGNWTTTGYDALGRVLSVTTPDSAVVSTAYSGAQVLVKDQAGKERMSQTNALGELSDVWEITAADSATVAVSFPGHSEVTAGYHTVYGYDVLEDLKTVTQGAQVRTFNYDSLKRLTSAINPESGTISYSYDSDGNLLTKTDARGVVSTYTYDALNRNTTITYTSDPASTPTVTHNFDGATNGKGRPWSSYTSGATASDLIVDSYDAMGRPLKQRQLFYANSSWGENYTVQQQYDLAGHVISETYPSGHTVTYNYDIAGRIADKDSTHPGFSGNLGEGVQHTYASLSATAPTNNYDAAGHLLQEQYGTATPVYHKLHYNVREQLYDIRLSTSSWQTNEMDWNRGIVALYYDAAHTWGATGTSDNGNVTASESWLPGNNQISSWQATQDAYTYDSLNRISTVTEHLNTSSVNNWNTQNFEQAFTYDRWGNRTINSALTSGGVNNKQFSVDATTNRLGVPSGQSGTMAYDKAGNLTTDSYTQNGGARVYDAQNRMVSAVDIQGYTDLYTYDGDGRRVRRNIGGQEWWQVYGIDGELLAEYMSGSTSFIPHEEYGYRNGELLITATNGNEARLTNFVNNIYYGALGQAPTAAQLQAGMNSLATAGNTGGYSSLLTAATNLIATLFVTPSPYNDSTQNLHTPLPTTNQQYVTDLYNTYLQRDPDSAGLTGRTNDVVTNGRAHTQTAFATSAEFYALVQSLYGDDGGDDTRTQDFVNNFYYGATQAAPSTTVLNSQVAALDAAAENGRGCDYAGAIDGECYLCLAGHG